MATLNPKYKSYSAYKSPGTEWLGDVPAHWDVQRLRHASEMRVSNVDKHTKGYESPVGLCNYVDVYNNEYITERTEFMSATATLAEIGRFRLEVGDVLITKDSEKWDDIGVPALVQHAADDLICGYHLALLRSSKSKLDGGYLLRALQSPVVSSQFHVEAKGVTRYGLTHSSIKSVQLPFPPLAEQRAIAAFLDRETAKIDALVSKKERLIELLREKRTAIISHLVTKGFNPDAPMKDSGIEWLGKIPKHWEVQRLRYLVEGNLTYGANAAAEYIDPNWPRYLRITDFAPDGTLREDSYRTLPPEIARDHLVEPGDLLLARSGATVGKAFLVDAAIGQACHAGYLIRVRPRRNLIEPKFLYAFVLSNAFTCWKDSTFIIATIQNISAEKYANLPIPTPPLTEQHAIVALFSQETTKLDNLIAKVRDAMKLLKEFRTALISAAVTGKIDVREETECT